VRLEVVIPREVAPADVAPKRSLAGVDPPVSLEVLRPQKSDLASGKLADVSLVVLGQRDERAALLLLWDHHLHRGADWQRREGRQGSLSSWGRW